MRLLILGTGGMANQHAKHFAAIEGVELVGGVDVDPKLLEAFNMAHNIPNAFPSLDAALAWGEFDAVANVTPDAIHHPTTLAALAAGKHVFCEKPLATDYPKALEMTEAAENAGLVAMVNLTYRNVAELQRARQIVQSGEIGKVKHVEASYLQSWLVSKAWGDWRTEAKWLWRLSRKHGSNGTLGDIGIQLRALPCQGIERRAIVAGRQHDLGRRQSTRERQANRAGLRGRSPDGVREHFLRDQLHRARQEARAECRCWLQQ